MYRYIFGPVPSRRLGISLGIDLVPPKVCSFNCIYCECGATTNLTVERKEYVPYESVISEIEEYLSRHEAPEYITFSGSGEPTLNSRIGDIIEYIKSNYGDIPTAVLTNGSLLFMKEVRQELLRADLVIPSLDAATERAFRSIDRPHKSLTTESYINGLIEFRKEFRGAIWLEVFISPGYNDNDQELTELKKAIDRINPDKLQLNSLDRPGTVRDLRSATQQEMEYVGDFLSCKNTEIIGRAIQRESVKSYRKDIESAILNTILRRPCTVEDISITTGQPPAEINKYLGLLQEKQRIKYYVHKDQVFYVISN